MAQGRVELEAGRVGRPHGLDGSFYVTGARARLLALGANVTVGARVAAIVRRAGTDEHPIVRVEGVEDRSAAEALRGAVLTVSTEEAPALGEGEWWAHELVGCDVLSGERLLGTVRRMLELPSCEALEVAREEKADPLLVPMVKDAIRSVDIGARRIDVDAGFLGLEEDAGAAREGGEHDGH
jgi:16S rRNA processing protein RimM